MFYFSPKIPFFLLLYPSVNCKYSSQNSDGQTMELSDQTLRGLNLINDAELIPDRAFENLLQLTVKKLLEQSEFHFTVLPTFEYSLLQENEKRTNIFRVLFILVTHLISSIPEWQKFFLVFSNSSINNYFNFSPSKYFITLFLITNIDIRIPICYKLNAPFLLDNSVEMNLKNFDFFETNIVQDS